MKESKFASAVVYVHDDEGGIKPFLTQLNDVLRENFLKYEVICVNDASTDGTVQAIRDFLAEHISENYTQEELSRRFDLPLTPMKACFRSAYGASIGAWLTDHRMNRAAELLISDPKAVIAEIGGMVGYDSPSKFAAAFKKAMKLTPSEYRRERGIYRET